MTRKDVVRDIKATKPCECGRVMILQQPDTVYLFDPPKYPLQWVCYGCGSVDTNAPVFVPYPRHNPTDLQRWRLANKESA